MADPKFTAGEKAQMAWLTARMAKRCHAGDGVHLADLQRKFDRIVEAAKKREADAGK